MTNMVQWGSKTHRDLCFSQYALRDIVKGSTVTELSLQTLCKKVSVTQKRCASRKTD